MRKYLIVATIEETLLPEAEKSIRENRQVIVCGVGAVNAIRAVRDIPRDADILNVGYVGSKDLPIGERVEIGDVFLFHPNMDYMSPGEFLGGTTPCYSSVDFVTDGSLLPKDAVVDMELAFIAALGFKHLRSIKYVSDNLNTKQYELCLKK